MKTMLAILICLVVLQVAEAGQAYMVVGTNVVMLTNDSPQVNHSHQPLVFTSIRDEDCTR